MADLKLDLSGLEVESEKLAKAIKVFEPYSKNFIQNTMNIFDGFNSDFISELKKTLDNMRDTKAPELVKDLKSFQRLAEDAQKEFQSQDENYADNLEVK